MKNDIEQYRQAYIEEALELLAELELCLLELEKTPDDLAVVDQIFRALHTIKGSGKMCGFAEIAELAHEIETVYDTVRAGALAATTGLIDLTLAASDLIRRMLSETVNDNSGQDSRSRELIAQFQALLSSSRAGVSLSKPADDLGPAASAGQPIDYVIRFQPAKELFLNGTNPLSLLAELHDLGPCRIITHAQDIPALSEINPQLCYTSWDAFLTTDRGIDEIKDVFIFLTDDCRLTIEPQRVERRRHTRRQAEDRRRDAVSTVRVPADRLDNLVDRVGELVTVKARLTQTAQTRQDSDLTAIAEEIERLTEELRDCALGLRTLPIGTIFSKLNRLVRDLAQSLGLQAELITEGEDTELDKTVIEKLDDLLPHLIRNSLDHGIEPADSREAAGKPRVGRISLSAVHSGAYVFIKVADDGAGLDMEAIMAQAVGKGLIAADAAVSEDELAGLILKPGFTTAKTVTDVSGRGVGMDVVKQSLDALNGSVEVGSRPGEGTTVTLKLPLTLAIIEGLLVSTAREIYVMPLSIVSECVELKRQEVEKSHGRRVASVRGELVPYIRLRDVFFDDDEQPPIEQIVIAEVERRRIGFVVDSVIGQHQTVIKNMGRVFKDLEGISGATILGDGRVALILDPPKLVQKAELEERALA